MLSLSTGMWGVSCLELSASELKEEGQELATKKDASVVFPETVEPLTHRVLPSPIEQTVENNPRHECSEPHLENPPLFTFDEFKERCPGHYYERVSIGDGLYLCGINTCKQYESFLTFESYRVRRHNARISTGEEFIESVIEAAESLEDTQFEVVQVLHKNDKKKYTLLGAILLGRRADDPETILVEKFMTRDSVHTKRSFIFEGFFKAFPTKLPAPYLPIFFPFDVMQLTPKIGRKR